MKVIFKEHQKSDGTLLAEVQMNRPEVLNALDLEMVTAIHTQLDKWRNNPRVSLIFLHGSWNVQKGDTFCAGGDVKNLHRALASAGKEGVKKICSRVQPFFESEYRLDYVLHNYPKMVVVWGGGLVMGGGLGLLWAGTHRIVTETSCLAMPEIAIGFFPDVGSSYFLSRLPRCMGWYLALTAYRFNSAESHFLGLSDFYFANREKEKVFETLLSASFRHKDELTQVLKGLESSLASHRSAAYSFGSLDNWLETNQDFIEELMSSCDKDVIFKKISESQNTDKKFLQNRQAFLSGSPTSIGIVCHLLKGAVNRDLRDVFETDLIVALHCVTHGDFKEGVYCRLIKKTRGPQWNPLSIEEVTDLYISRYFKKEIKGPGNFLISRS